MAYLKFIKAEAIKLILSSGKKELQVMAFRVARFDIFCFKKLPGVAPKQVKFGTRFS